MGKVQQGRNAHHISVRDDVVRVDLFSHNIAHDRGSRSFGIGLA